MFWFIVDWYLIPWLQVKGAMENAISRGTQSPNTKINFHVDWKGYITELYINHHTSFPTSFPASILHPPWHSVLIWHGSSTWPTHGHGGDRCIDRWTASRRARHATSHVTLVKLHRHRGPADGALSRHWLRRATDERGASRHEYVAPRHGDRCEVHGVRCAIGREYIPEGWLEIDKHYSLELCFSIEKQPETV